MTETTDLERELRAALADAHADALEPPGLADRLVAAATSGPSTPRRSGLRPSRRWLPPLAAAAAVLALVVGIDAVVTSLRDDGSRPASKNPGLTTPLSAPQSLLDVRKFGFHVAEENGILVNDVWGIDDQGEWTDVVVGGDWAIVKVLYQGRSPRPLTGTSEDVTVNGLAGTYSEDVRPDGFTARLLWQYAPDSWAEVGISGDGAPSPDLRQHYLTVAEAVRPGGKALLLPVRFGAVPAALPSIAKPHELSVSCCEGDWSMRLSVDGVSISATSAVDRGECRGDNGEPQTAEFTYRGHKGCVVDGNFVVDGAGVEGRRLVLHLDDADVSVDYAPGPALPLEDMKRLLGGMTVAKTGFDYSTWFDLRTALGG